ncbi:MAG: hypothetical protein ABID87_02875 [Chloroflexota bacterium]
MDFAGLEPGDEFPPTAFQLDAETVAAYLEAVEGENHRRVAGETVPPLAVAARALAALSAGLELPPGAIHVGQVLGFRGTVKTGERLTSHARVARKIARGKLNMLAIDFEVRDERQTTVLTGETSFVLPPPAEES